MLLEYKSYFFNKIEGKDLLVVGLSIVFFLFYL